MKDSVDKKVLSSSRSCVRGRKGSSLRREAFKDSDDSMCDLPLTLNNCHSMLNSAM
jgi:hypothetical protein